MCTILLVRPQTCMHVTFDHSANIPWLRVIQEKNYQGIGKANSKLLKDLGNYLAMKNSNTLIVSFVRVL